MTNVNLYMGPMTVAKSCYWTAFSPPWGQRGGEVGVGAQLYIFDVVFANNL